MNVLYFSSFLYMGRAMDKLIDQGIVSANYKSQPKSVMTMAKPKKDTAKSKTEKVKPLTIKEEKIKVDKKKIIPYQPIYREKGKKEYPDWL